MVKTLNQRTDIYSHQVVYFNLERITILCWEGTTSFKFSFIIDYEHYLIMCKNKEKRLMKGYLHELCCEADMDWHLQPS